MGGRRQPLNIRDETREAAGELMPLIIKYIRDAVANGGMTADTGDALLGMHKNNVYLIELSKMEDTADGGGEREVDQPPEALRLRLAGGR